MPSLPRSPFGRRSARRSTAEHVPQRDEPRVEIVEAPGLRWINIERPRQVDLAWLAERLAETGAEAHVMEAAREANTALEVLENTEGHYVRPAIAVAENHYEIVQQETFAPILYLIRYETLEEAIRLVERDGWYLVRVTGSHRQYHHDVKRGTVTIAGKPGADVPRGVWASILRQAGLTEGRER
jgi:predicted RNA binding protein YcfA (HicA-like mRNA interferase family)